MKKLNDLSASAIEESATNLFAFSPKKSYVEENWIKEDKHQSQLRGKLTRKLRSLNSSRQTHFGNAIATREKRGKEDLIGSGPS